jgi:SAM-dependent methyltransferase
MIVVVTAVSTPERLAEVALAVRTVVRAESLPPRLDEATYLRTQKIYEAHSDQRIRIAQWLGDRLPALPSTRATVRVLSVGCGDGSLDVALAATLRARGHRVEYVGVEPSATAGVTFTERVGQLPGVEATVVPTRLEDAALRGRFDLIVAIHSLYYVDQPAAQMRRLIDVLHPGGSIVVMNAPLGGLNQLVEALAPDGGGTSLVYSDTVNDILVQLGYTARRQRIEAALDLSPCFDPQSEMGRDILQFLTHADLTSLSSGAYQALLDYLRAITLVPGGTLVPHPVDVLTVTDFA